MSPAQRPDELTLEEIRAYLDSQAPPGRRPAHVLAYREAAAVLAAIADLERLQPLGAAPAGKAAELLGPDLIPATGTAFNGQVMLAPEIRAATIRDLVATGRVQAALDRNPAERDSTLQAHLERYLRREAPPLDAQTVDELDATLQVAVWLGGVIDGIPAVSEVAKRAGYQRLLAPFETLAGDAIFRGRRKELDRLRRYIGVVAPESRIERMRGRLGQWVEPEEQPAVSLSGIGGAGKSSLVARFMLEHTRLPEEERIPFGYLDFARASLDVGDPVGLSAELTRQLDLQFPQLDLARGFRFLEEWRPGNGVPREPETAGQLAGRAMSVLSDILGILGSRLGPRPFVLVLDTFEEVQYRGEERAHPFWKLLEDLQRRWPFLRVVVAGRAPVETLRLADRPPRRIELGDLDDEAAGSFLDVQGIGDPAVQQDIIRTFGRLPLSLKLVGSLAARTAGGAAALLAEGNSLSLLTASDEVIQAQLYGRFLDHIADERIRRIAHPGLTLRRLNPALILEVLNEPCDLQISTIEEAAELFAALRRESSLVSVDSGDGDLVHRPDLRRVMLKMLLAGAPAVTQAIHRGAVDWYGRQSGTRALAEYTYHLLHLGLLSKFDDYTYHPLADRQVRASIQAVIDEFSVETQLYLATQGLKVPPEVQAQASRDQKHAAVAAQIEDLLPYGREALAEAEQIFQGAYADVRTDGPGVRAVVRSVLGRTDQGASPVFRAGARIAAQGGDDRRALDLIEQGLERAAREGAAELTLGLLQDRAWLYRERPAAEQAQGLTLLAEHALRHEHLAARIQHRAQSVRGFPGMADPADLAALRDLLGQASPHDLWNLLPAVGRAAAFATGWSSGDDSFRTTSIIQGMVTTTGGEPVRRSFSVRTSPFTLTEPLAALVRATPSPFRTAVFPDAVPRSALSRVLRDANFEPMASVAQAEFLRGVFRLCAVWPYRILSVAAPEGRRGEQLTIA